MECIQSAISSADKLLSLLYSALNLFRKKPPSISTAIFVGGSVCNVSFLIVKNKLAGGLVHYQDLADATGTNVAVSVIVVAKIHTFLKKEWIILIYLCNLELFQINLPLVLLLSLPKFVNKRFR